MRSNGSPPITAALPHDDSKDNSRNAPQGHTCKSSSTPATSLKLPSIEFQTKTIAPSPPASQLSLHHNTSERSESTSPLRISTNVSAPIPITPSNNTKPHATSIGLSPPRALNNAASSNKLHPLSRTPSVKAAVTNHSNSFGGSSPILSMMGDMTPLPSPLLSCDSPGPWKRLNTGSTSPSQSRSKLNNAAELPSPITANTDSANPDCAMDSHGTRKQYGELEGGDAASIPPSSTKDQVQPQRAHHGRHRSVSEYIPDPTPAHKRHVVVSGSHFNSCLSPAAQESQMRRELNFAESRGITPTAAQPPSPPSSSSSKELAEGIMSKDDNSEVFEARGRHDQKRRRWRSVGFLGQGTFSRVMLASSQLSPSDYSQVQPIAASSSIVADKSQRKKLVAVKVCEQGPRGGASEERIEMSLKRELEIMQTIQHPSLVNLKAWSIEPTRAILVLSYCPGGDLFDIATTHRKLLTPILLRRVFAELVGAIKYLHERNIVHRDIKLENALVNLTPSELADSSVDWTTFPTAVITLADLGLSRRITDDEKLETRCGSDDYAAPEVIMGQPYDGRATDAWSLGVLLFALLESRLPFDPHPGMSDAHRMRSRTSHRIARVEWRWVEYSGDDGDHEANEAKFKDAGLFGAMEITEGLLKRSRSRWTMDKVASHPWVRDAMQIPGGLQFKDEDEGEVV